jgi:hypothetical protein
METTLTDFQRNFSVARSAADRGETVTVRSGSAAYLFLRASQKPKKPFADLQAIFGVARLAAKKASNREIIRHRLKTRHAH